MVRAAAADADADARAGAARMLSRARTSQRRSSTASPE
jgi:hypothetical protein